MLLRCHMCCAVDMCNIETIATNLKNQMQANMLEPFSIWFFQFLFSLFVVLFVVTSFRLRTMSANAHKMSTII